ncbi:histidine phosphatase family protein [Roseateles koreensis]|uniref:Histidine phosphatase family protein n=1 Tax=Roseateles koreensis TaxID=2987526 RepID=A0ABT5KP66_9BURK|nr:histidine phosphatase family protein [Roseateles koreensis]MDC8784699.1 histidine phosphatase family protein [Roseateles koreensis]
MDHTTRILAIRHGETAWNRETRLQGHLDIPLNTQGVAQARQLALALKDESVAAVYASDLQRARQTAEAIADEKGLPLQLEPRLRERAFGCFEGLTWQEIAERWPAQSEAWRRRDPTFGAEGGEVLQDFYARSVKAVTELARAHPGQTIVVVSHGGVMDCLHRAGMRLSLTASRSWKLGNAAINRLLYSPEGFSVVGWNDESHLEHLAGFDRPLDEIKERSA